MRSGWSAKWSSRDSYVNIHTNESSKMIDNGMMHFPGFDAGAVKWLIDNRSISGIGVDTLSFDAGYKDSFPAHIELLTKKKYGIENMNITNDIPDNGCLLVALPARIKGAPETWIRCVAIQPHDTQAKL